MQKAEITKDMERWFEKRTEQHQKLVQKYCNKIANKWGGVFDALRLRGQYHDRSKLISPERRPYIFITWDHKVDEYEIPSTVDKLGATRRHILTNSHHPEFHDDRLNEKTAREILEPETRDWNPKTPVHAESMPALDICEMVADWAAMSEELGTNTTREWANRKVGERWIFTDSQKDFIYTLIDLCEEDDPK